MTEQERLTSELLRREAYLAEAQRLSHTGRFGWKPDTGEIVWSDETFCIFEYDHATKPNLDMVLDRIHPQDRALAQQIFRPRWGAILRSSTARGSEMPIGRD